MNIALDIDGTITDIPEFFRILSGAILSSGGEVHVITYRDEEDRTVTEKDLVSWGVDFTELHMASKDLPPADCPDWKAQVVTANRVELIFEDSPEVLNKTPEGVVRLWLCNPEVYDIGKVIQYL